MLKYIHIYGFSELFLVRIMSGEIYLIIPDLSTANPHSNCMVASVRPREMWYMYADRARTELKCNYYS